MEVLGSLSAEPTTQVETRTGMQPMVELTCSGCGATIDDATDDHAACPACGMAGYVDRSGRYLLPLSWACTACGAENEGDAAHCAHCDFELPADCLRCGATLEGIVCEACGGHQARLLQLQQEADRRSQRASALPYESPPHNTASVVDWVPVGTSINVALRRYRALIVTGAVLGVLIAVALLAGGEIVSLAHQALTALRASPWFIALQQAAAQWWAAFHASLADPLRPNDPEYSYLFATVVFMVALFPFAVLFLRRVVRRLFR
jgi:DNA-directed RNA polymerase subunit RPC12/RpoP